MGEAARKLEGASLTRMLSIVKEHTGITMEERKKELLSARINRRLRVLGMNDFDNYMDHIKDSESERQEFVNLVTTNETHFFRTPVVWNYFENEYLPWRMAQSDQGPLRVWSAASSTGQEAYTISMLCEEAKGRHLSFKFNVQASDIATDVLAKAQSGQFSGKTIEELKKSRPDFFNRYFQPLDEGYQFFSRFGLKPEFFQHNLHHSPPREGFYDVIFLRNVLIYFSTSDQELVLRNMYQALKPGGILVLGESESLARFKTDFQFLKPLIYKKV